MQKRVKKKAAWSKRVANADTFLIPNGERVRLTGVGT